MGPLAPTPCPLGPPTAPPPCTMTWRVPSPQALGHPTPEAFSAMVQSPVLSRCHPPPSGSTCMMCHTQVTAHRLLCPGYSCRVWCPGHPQDQGATARCCAHGMVPWCGTLVGCREARASCRKPGTVRQGAGGSRHSPKAWACAELGAFSAARAARTQHCAHAAGRGEACRGTSWVCMCAEARFSPQRAAGTACGTGHHGGSGWGRGHCQSCPGAGITVPGDAQSLAQELALPSRSLLGFEIPSCPH